MVLSPVVALDADGNALAVGAELVREVDLNAVEACAAAQHCVRRILGVGGEKHVVPDTSGEHAFPTVDQVVVPDAPVRRRAVRERDEAVVAVRHR